jgi:hypothetical protein
MPRYEDASDDPEHAFAAPRSLRVDSTFDSHRRGKSFGDVA